MSDIVNKLWGFCHTLRHAGVDYGDYIEQITYLLFLKMADESDVELPKGHDWSSLHKLSGSALIDHYADVLRKLREEEGILGDIFNGAQSRLDNPVDLKKLINLIDAETWSEMGVDVKGAAFEGLLERAASEGKKGAGQYFTPRPLIESICNVMKPDPRANPQWTLCDPACGTGGFVICAYDWLKAATGNKFDYRDFERIKTQTYYAQDLVQRPRRLALMNAFLHGLEPHIYLGDTIYEAPRSQQFDCILTNPPFGTRGANQAPARDDFTIETSNKQLNFVQHVVNALKPGGRAAMVLPDNCLFEGKAGEVFELLMQDCNLHTVLRLPRGTFTPYSQGVKANVIFFQKGQPTKQTWIYDARANVPGVTKKDRPLSSTHFAGFEKAYGADPNGTSTRKENDPEDRFKCFSIAEIQKRDYKLDITWLRDESLEDGDELPEPQDLASEAIVELEAVVDELKEILALIEAESGSEAVAV